MLGPAERIQKRVAMDKSDNTIGRRDFIRVVGGTLVATELGIVGCADENSSGQRPILV
jgi:hypothetical protein